MHKAGKNDQSISEDLGIPRKTVNYIVNKYKKNQPQVMPREAVEILSLPRET